MEKISITLLLCLFAFTPLHSQDPSRTKIDSLEFLANRYSRHGNYSMAIQLESEVLNIAETIYGKNHNEYAISLNNLSSFYSDSGNNTEALRLEIEATEIMKKVWGKKDSHYATCLGNLAELNYRMGNYTEGIQLAINALKLVKKIYGELNYNYAKSLGLLAGYKNAVGNYAEAILLGIDALEIIEKVLGKEHPQYAISLNNLSNYYYELGNYAEAIRLCAKALEIMEQGVGKENQDYASSLNNLACYYSDMGNLSEAVRLETESMLIRERILGKSHPDYAVSLNNLAGINSALGNHPEAIRLCTEVLEIRATVLGKEHPSYATSLNNLASYYSELGNYDEAIRLGTEALEIREHVFGKEHPDYAASLNNLAGYYSNLGNYEEAIRSGTEALQIREKILGKEHPNYATSLNNLSSYYADLGNYDEAIRLGTEALEIREKVFGKEHPDYAASLNNLAYYNYHLDNLMEAVHLCSEAQEIRERIMGEKHPHTIMSICNMAGYNFEGMRYNEASYYIAKASPLRSQLIQNNFLDLTTYERTLFWNEHRKWFETFIPEATYYIRNDTLVSIAYNVVLMSKGLLLNSEIEMSRLLLESGDTAVVRKYKELQTNRMMLNRLYEKPIAERYMNADSLQHVIESQEKELVRLSKTYGDYTRNLGIDWRQVRDKLGDKDVAIEFLNFGARNDSVMYAALTLTRNDSCPRMTPLFEKRELEGMEKTGYHDTSELGDMVWKPLAGVLEGKENIYFSPSGELHNIAIESVPCYEGDGYMSDRWNIYRLSSTRELAVEKEGYGMSEAYIYGDLRYDTDMDVLASEGGKYGDTKRDIDWEVEGIADSLSVRGSRLSPLPATRREVENVYSALRERNVSSTLLTGTSGTETSVKELSGRKPGVLHIATHGFYWTESDVKAMDSHGRPQALTDEGRGGRYVEDKALTRSGLFFAGAQNALDGTETPEGVDDGILTAREISVLDLRGLDLVVLSACETGLGDITGDGVFGLQRGFLKAGANTLVMSLWKVDDAATERLMSRFYSNLARGEAKYDAFREAQRYLRDEYPDPEDWAAFIIMDAIK